MTSMNEPEVVTSLLEQIDKLTEEANRYRYALQGINEIQVNSDDAAEMKDIAREALEGEEQIVKVEHEGHLFTFGESTIEVEYAGPKDDFPFKRIKKGE